MGGRDKRPSRWCCTASPRARPRQTRSPTFASMRRSASRVTSGHGPCVAQREPTLRAIFRGVLSQDCQHHHHRHRHRHRHRTNTFHQWEPRAASQGGCYVEESSHTRKSSASSTPAVRMTAVPATPSHLHHPVYFSPPPLSPANPRRMAAATGAGVVQTASSAWRVNTSGAVGPPRRGCGWVAVAAVAGWLSRDSVPGVGGRDRGGGGAACAAGAAAAPVLTPTRRRDGCRPRSRWRQRIVDGAVARDTAPALACGGWRGVPATISLGLLLFFWEGAHRRVTSSTPSPPPAAADGHHWPCASTARPGRPALTAKRVTRSATLGSFRGRPPTLQQRRRLGVARRYRPLPSGGRRQWR